MVNQEETPPAVKLKVLLVDTLVARLGVLKVLVESQTVGSTMVGTASNASTAVEAVNELAPDVVMLEIQLPVEAGMETLCTLRGCFPTLPIVVCSFRRDRETKEQAIRAGANVFLDKPVTAHQIAAAFAQVVPSPSYEPEMS